MWKPPLTSTSSVYQYAHAGPPIDHYHILKIGPTINKPYAKDTTRYCPHTILLRTLINPDAKQQAGIVPFPIHPALCRNVPHSSSQDMTTINGMNTMKAFHNNDARSLMVLYHQKMNKCSCL
ncbi:hypothetical protein T05_2099 [Trichinella murrelli]|uniref:Uncharacterized protein n=1 Tax=Trichinella murrelli TaxID=144512 RepID=A0A0V0U4R1_9BILA|nr:hypothetical protein T05_2099 [Trichinella murrelli]